MRFAFYSTLPFYKRIIPLTELVFPKADLSLPSWKQRRHQRHSWQKQNLFWPRKKRGHIWLCLHPWLIRETKPLWPCWGFISLLASSLPNLTGHNCACGHAVQPTSCQFVRKLVPDSDEDIKPGRRFCGILVFSLRQELLKKQALVERTWIFESLPACKSYFFLELWPLESFMFLGPFSYLCKRDNS